MNEEINSTVDRRLRRKKISKETGACDRCPPHDHENRSRRVRDDRHKNHRRGPGTELI